MTDFKKIFSKYGYSLFEPESIEDAVIDALKSGEIRYILGIPIILENSDVDFEDLISKAKKNKILDGLLDIFYISSMIIKNKKKISALKKLIKNKSFRKKFDKNEFREIYDQYSKTKAGHTFSSSTYYHLSFIFTAKQIEILYKIKNGEALTKTEKEYYSRVIKKRLVAIKELSSFVRDFV